MCCRERSNDTSLAERCPMRVAKRCFVSRGKIEPFKACMNKKEVVGGLPELLQCFDLTACSSCEYRTCRIRKYGLL